MTPKAQRIAIAEWCGWDFDKSDVNHGMAFKANDKRLHSGIPDYFNDLNAIHEAEKGIYSKAQSYCEWLDKVVGHHNELYSLTFATAAQRSEALLKTLNLWQE